MPVGSNVVGPGVTLPGGGNPSPPGTGGAVHTITSTQLLAGHQVDAASDRFLTLQATATSATAQITLSVSPDGVTYTEIGNSEVNSSVIALTLAAYVPRGWFVQATLFNATFTSCTYW